MKTIINFYENGKTTDRKDDLLVGSFVYDIDYLVDKEMFEGKYFYTINEDLLHEFIEEKFEIPYVPSYNTGNYTEFLEYYDSTIGITIIGITIIGIMLGDNEKYIARVLKIKSILND